MARDDNHAAPAPSGPPPSAPDSQPQPVQDGIPQARDQRDRLLQLIRRYVAANGLVPPLKLSELLLHVESVLRTAGLDAKYKEYAAVLCNNEVWRGALAGVPCDRRLLLLPLCLRDAARCAGKMDEFGLVCRHCSPCPINDLTTEAERLGYVTLVCEGTTVVMSLIESGKIEAVVGVGCLSSLQKVYPLMAAAGMPGMAIPLLRDGCANTAVDVDWVRDVLAVTGPQCSAGTAMDVLRRRVRAWFTAGRLAEVLGPAGSETEQIAREWLVRSGKRWRPFLAACAFHALRDGAPDLCPHDPAADLMRVGVAVECFHKASLVHDDIEDSDALRYGRKTLHEQHGLPVALNVGDFLIGEGYRLLAECDAPAGVKAQLLHAAAVGHRELCLGQGRELCWRRGPGPLSADQVAGIYSRKTAPAFEVALRFGAILAGGRPELAEILHRYSRHLGIAYQIRDDLADFRSDGGGGDCEALRPSILLAMAYEAAGGKQRELIEAAWRGSIGADRAGELADRITELGAEDAARRLMAYHDQQAENTLGPLAEAGLKRLLRQVLGKIFHGERKGQAGESARPSASRRGRGAGSAA